MRALLLVALLSACQDRLTWVMVRIDNVDLTVPTDIQTLQISVSNPGKDGMLYQSPALRLCAKSAAGCYSFPITLTLRPGDKQPGLGTRVQVDAFQPDGTRVISNASVFSFASGTEQTLELGLFKGCLETECAKHDQACVQAGYCSSVAPKSQTSGPADLAPRGPIERESLLSDCVDVNGRDHLPIRPPAAQPGDLVLLSLSGHAIKVPDGDLPGWRSLGGLSNLTRILARFADVGEATATGLYQLAITPVSYDANLCWDTIVYRNVGAVEPGTLQRAPPFQLAPVLQIPSGGVVVGMVGADNPICKSVPGVSLIANSAGWSVFETAITDGQVPALDLDCVTNGGGGVGDVYQLILSP